MAGCSPSACDPRLLWAQQLRARPAASSQETAGRLALGPACWFWGALGCLPSQPDPAGVPESCWGDGSSPPLAERAAWGASPPARPLSLGLGVSHSACRHKPALVLVLMSELAPKGPAPHAAQGSANALPGWLSSVGSMPERSLRVCHSPKIATITNSPSSPPAGRPLVGREPGEATSRAPPPTAGCVPGPPPSRPCVVPPPPRQPVSSSRPCPGRRAVIGLWVCDR